MFNHQRNANLIRAIALASTAVGGLLATPAGAQTMDFPQRFVEPDEYGTDMVTGKPVLSRIEGSIGTGPDALVMQRVWSGTGWQDNIAGKLNRVITNGQERVTLALGIQALSFTKANGVFTPDNGDGSSLTESTSGTAYTFTTASGTVYQYGNPDPQGDIDPDFPLPLCDNIPIPAASCCR